uniref:DUF2059 domain-containing protein n=1 Tax=Steinernema glaseri TaxID=37863 RepID=A0A1I7YMW3_9BILA
MFARKTLIIFMVMFLIQGALTSPDYDTVAWSAEEEDRRLVMVMFHALEELQEYVRLGTTSFREVLRQPDRIARQKAMRTLSAYKNLPDSLKNSSFARDLVLEMNAELISPEEAKSRLLAAVPDVESFASRSDVRDMLRNYPWIATDKIFNRGLKDAFYEWEQELVKKYTKKPTGSE